MAGGTIPAGTVIGTYVVPCDVHFLDFGKAIDSRNRELTCNGPGFLIAWRDANTSSKFVITASASSIPNKVVRSGGVYNDNVTPTPFTIDGQTVYYGSMGASIESYEPAPDPHPEQNLTGQQFIAWAMIYGGFGGFSVTYDLVNCTGDESNPTIIAPEAAITNFLFTPSSGMAFVSSSVTISGDGYPPGNPVSFVFDPDSGQLKIGSVSSSITINVTAYGDPYATIDGEGALPGGGTVAVPGLPGLSATSTGIIGLFAPTIAQMQALSDFMWTDFGGQGTTEIEVLSEIVQAIKRSISNPLDYIIGLNIIPSQGLSVGAAQTVKFGFVSSGISMQKLSNQYFTVDCGTISFPTLCGDTFLDYAPYSKFSIYLPYIGFKDLDANDCVGHTIGVYYHGDVVTGGITAYITKDGSVMYQFAGGCALNIPLSADGWGSTIAGAVQIASSAIAAGATGGVAGAAKAAAQGAAAVAANPSLMSPKVSHSGAVSGGAGLMGIQTPFIIREAVRFHSTTGFNRLSGYPAFYYRSLSSVAGYTKVLDLHLHGIPATQDEITEIESLLKEGVIF